MIFIYKPLFHNCNKNFRKNFKYGEKFHIKIISILKIIGYEILGMIILGINVIIVNIFTLIILMRWRINPDCYGRKYKNKRMAGMERR